MSYRDFINRLSVTPAGRSIASTFAARVDPVLYKISGGRLTSVGPQVIPQLLLTTTGRKSGKERTVQLGYTKDGDDLLVVASNFGGTNHPGWSHNLDANPKAKIQLASEKTEVVAARLTDSEKAILWPKIVGTIPQMKSYVKRTERNIKVYRLALLTLLALVLGVPVTHQFDGATASAGSNYEFTPYGFCRNNWLAGTNPFEKRSDPFSTRLRRRG